MNLYQFRKHLAVEIGNLPVEPDAATQSYAVTTAALARKILGYLNANNLTLPNALEPDTQSYKLRTVLDRIIHFKTLGPDAISFDYPGEPNLVTLYSDKHLRYKDHLYIRLTDYRDVIGRLATDDILVAHYLFRYTVTLLSRVVKTKEEPQSHKEETALVELRRSIFGYTLNAWDILLDLLDAGRVEIPASPIDCYEELFEEGERNTPASRPVENSSTDTRRSGGGIVSILTELKLKAARPIACHFQRSNRRRIERFAQC